MFKYLLHIESKSPAIEPMTWDTHIHNNITAVYYHVYRQHTRYISRNTIYIVYIKWKFLLYVVPIYPQSECYDDKNFIKTIKIMANILQCQLLNLCWAEYTTSISVYSMNIILSVHMWKEFECRFIIFIRFGCCYEYLGICFWCFFI